MSESAHSDWETVIGLEIHAQLSTKSKIFSSSAEVAQHGKMLKAPPPFPAGQPLMVMTRSTLK